MSSTTTTTGGGLEGVVAGESEICYIDGYAGILSYRGYNIHTLAECATFEEVIWLLWKGWLPKQDELDRLKAALFANYAIPQQVVDFLKANQIDYTDADIAGVQDWIKANIKAELFTSQFGQLEGMKVRKEADPEINKAMTFLPEAMALEDRDRSQQKTASLVQ